MSQDGTGKVSTDLSDLEGIQATLFALQRRLGKAPSSEEALTRDAVREALLVISRARQLRDTSKGVTTKGR